MNSHPLAVHLFARAARIVLPRRFEQEFASELRDSFADQYRMVRGRSSASVAAFALRELAGLLATAGREYREIIFGSHTRRRRVRPLAPRRNREVINTLRQDLIYSVRMSETEVSGVRYRVSGNSFGFYQLGSNPVLTPDT